MPYPRQPPRTLFSSRFAADKNQIIAQYHNFVPFSALSQLFAIISRPIHIPCFWQHSKGLSIFAIRLWRSILRILRSFPRKGPSVTKVVPSLMNPFDIGIRCASPPASSRNFRPGSEIRLLYPPALETRNASVLPAASSSQFGASAFTNTQPLKSISSQQCHFPPYRFILSDVTRNISAAPEYGYCRLSSSAAFFSFPSSQYRTYQIGNTS